MGLLQFSSVALTRLTCLILIPQVVVGSGIPGPSLFSYPSHLETSEIYRPTELERPSEFIQSNTSLCRWRNRDPERRWFLQGHAVGRWQSWEPIQGHSRAEWGWSVSDDKQPSLCMGSEVKLLESRRPLLPPSAPLTHSGEGSHYPFPGLGCEEFMEGG